MSCENRYGTPCYEFMCGSSENGICTANAPKEEVLPSMEELLNRAYRQGRVDERAKILKALKEEHYKFGYKSLADAIEMIEQMKEKKQ